MRAIFLIILLTPVLLSAHKVNIFAKKEQERIHVKAYYSKNAPCKSCEVTLLDKKNRLIKTKTSDENGEIYFSFPKKDVAQIEVSASMGHKNVIDFQVKGNKDSLPFFAKVLIAIFISTLLFSILFFIKKEKR